MSTLHDLLPPGTTVYTILRHVSKSSMSRDISLVILTPDGPRDITALAAEAMGAWLSKNCPDAAIRVGGCGMDMGYHLVYSLARTLYPDGHMCTGDRDCPSNDHSNDYGRLAREWDKAHGEIDPAATREEWEARYGERQQWISSRRTYRRNRRHSDGGYALRQRWM